MSGYSFHPDAVKDLEEIWEFIAQDSLDASDQVLDDIQEAIQMLVRMPRQGHQRTELTSRPLRFWRVHSYLIPYVPEEPLLVIAVLHGRRNPRVMAAILKTRT